MTQRAGRWSLDNKKSASAREALKSIIKDTPKRRYCASGYLWVYGNNGNNINGSWISANIGWQSVRPYRQDLHFQLSEFRSIRHRRRPSNTLRGLVIGRGFQ